MMEQTRTQANTPPQEPLPMQDKASQNNTGTASEAQAAAVAAASAAAAAAAAAASAVVSSPSPSQSSSSDSNGSGLNSGSVSSSAVGKSGFSKKKSASKLSSSQSSRPRDHSNDSGIVAIGLNTNSECSHRIVGHHSHLDDYVQDARQMGNHGFVTPSQSHNNSNNNDNITVSADDERNNNGNNKNNINNSVAAANVGSQDSIQVENQDMDVDVDMDMDMEDAGRDDDDAHDSDNSSSCSSSSSSSSSDSSSSSTNRQKQAASSKTLNFNSERRPSSFNTAIAHNNTTIFKPFDSQTGQFLPPSSASTKNNDSQDLMDTHHHRDLRPDDTTTASSPPSTSPSTSTMIPNNTPSLMGSLAKVNYEKDENSVTNIAHQNQNEEGLQFQESCEEQMKDAQQQQKKKHNHTLNAQPSLNRIHRSKMRSFSVPTILHSSLRKMSNVAQHEMMIPCKHNLPPAHLTLKHPNNSSASLTNSNSNLNPNCSQPGGLVRKKRSLKRDQFSLRNAILMTHRLQTMDSKDIPLEERIKYIKTYPTPIPLPPINLQCLKEIDLSEIVKNPQLRHDIVFDPMLQFRPNLDGERGIKKRQIADKYWSDVENEIYVYNQRPDVFDENRSRLVPLFNTLKDVLVTIVPQKEVSTVANVLDTELLIQELLKGSLVMSNFSDWLSQLFKHHCAPMRDPWVDKMSSKFKKAEENNSISTLVEALRLVFQILEAMKLDIANHQIRILRPALLSNTVDFEKQYFQSLLNSNRVDLKSSLKWFAEKYNDACADNLIDPSKPTPIPKLYQVCIRSVISLLSCRKMVKEYPTALSFDHARLILLRADIRQIVCLMVCKLLFKQLVANNADLTRPMKEFIIKNYTTKRLKEEIVSIITDEHGNCRWTKNTLSIAVQLNKVIDQLKEEYLRQYSDGTQSSGVGAPQVSSSSSANLSLDHKKIDFATSWLSKQTQPLSDVYGVLEARVFKSLEEIVFKFGECSKDGTVKQDFINMCGNTNTTTNATGTATSTLPMSNDDSAGVSTSIFQSTSEANRTSTSKKEMEIKESLAAIDMEEFENSYRHLYTVVNFHWSVFGCHYLEYMGDKVEKV